MGYTEWLHASTSGRRGARPLVLAHGFGCGQHMWRRIAPAFEADHEVVRYDLMGAGGSQHDHYDPDRYSSLRAHAEDLVGLCEELGLRDVVLVGHSVSSMIAVLAQRARPDLVSALVLVSPSARYLDDAGYDGGFSGADIEELLALMDSNQLEWQAGLSARVAGGPGLVAQELEESFCSMRPDIARHFAGVTFRGDNRADLPGVDVPTLVLQSRVDAIAPVPAGRLVHDMIEGSTFEILDTTGHCPHLTAPAETIAAMRTFLATL